MTEIQKENLVLSDPDETSSSSSDSGGEGGTPMAESKIEKPKRVRSVAQQQAWIKALEVRRQKAEERKKIKEEAEKVIEKVITKKKETKMEKEARIADKKQRRDARLEKLKELAETVSDGEEEPEPKVVRRRKKVVYVDSDGEEVEGSDKPVVIINKIAPTISNKKPSLIPPKNIPVFV